MRRARHYAASTSPRPLRPFIFLVLSLFLVLPMVVYNFFTLDFSRLASIRGAMSDPVAIEESLPAALEACAAITMDRIMSPSATTQLRQQCFSTNETTEVPNIVHFVYLPVQMVPLQQGEEQPPPENFTMVQFAAVESIRQFFRPELIVMHYPANEPRSYWYTQCQRHMSLHRVLFPRLPTEKSSSLNVYQRRDVLQLLIALRALRTQGGVAFTDFNTFVMRPLNHLRHLPFLIGRSKKNEFSISPALLIGSSASNHMLAIEKKIQHMLETDDSRLQSSPLERVLGDLLIDLVTAEGASDTDKPNVAVTARRVLDAVPAHQLNDFLSIDATDSSINLRESLAFRFAHANPGGDAVVRDGVEHLQLFQSRVKSLQDVTTDKSLFGAIMRYSAMMNRTAELDSVLAH